MQKAIWSLAIIFVLIIGAATVSADDTYPLAVSVGAGLNTLNGGAPPWFGVRPQLRFRLDTYLWRNWRAEMMYTRFTLYDDAGNSSEISLSTDVNERTRAWRGYDVGIMAKKRWRFFDENVAITTGLGGGLSIWEMNDPSSDTLLLTINPYGGITSYEATQIFLAGSIGIERQLHRNWRIGFDFNLNYLTGAGLKFAETVEEDLGRWNLKAGISIGYIFGGRDDKTYTFKRFSRVNSNSELTSSRPLKQNSVTFIRPDYNTAYANITNSSEVDSDHDGVPDLEDDCPRTPIEAAGLIDVRGCPIDSDADGVPDYRDHCPDNLIGAAVDDAGCPKDSDGDGVPDGLDDCPDTESGMQVDQYGCVDLKALRQKITLHIRYREGSFEIDYKTRPVLDSVAMILQKAPGVTVEINAFTDNIGTFGTNKTLSQKRANRIRDYLVSKGIASERLVPIGRGETNFIATNNTAAGRQENRRVELFFYR